MTTPITPANTPLITTPATPLVPVRLAPSQTRHPWQATLRTVLAVIIGAASVAPEVVGVAHISGGTLGVAAGQLVVVTGAITKIIALPKVNAWLTKLGLGAEPKA